MSVQHLKEIRFTLESEDGKFLAPADNGVSTKPKKVYRLIERNSDGSIPESAMYQCSSNEYMLALRRELYNIGRCNLEGWWAEDLLPDLKMQYEFSTDVPGSPSSGELVIVDPNINAFKTDRKERAAYCLVAGRRGTVEWLLDSECKHEKSVWYVSFAEYHGGDEDIIFTVESGEGKFLAPANNGVNTKAKKVYRLIERNSDGSIPKSAMYTCSRSKGGSSNEYMLALRRELYNVGQCNLEGQWFEDLLPDLKMQYEFTSRVPGFPSRGELVSVDPNIDAFKIDGKERAVYRLVAGRGGKVEWLLESECKHKKNVWHITFTEYQGGAKVISTFNPISSVPAVSPISVIPEEMSVQHYGSMDDIAYSSKDGFIVRRGRDEGGVTVHVYKFYNQCVINKAGDNINQGSGNQTIGDVSIRSSINNG